MCANIRTYVRTYVCVYVRMYTHMHVFLRTSLLCPCGFLHTIFVHVKSSTCTYMCMYICTYICTRAAAANNQYNVWVCTYVHTYVCIQRSGHIRTYTYTYVYKHHITVRTCICLLGYIVLVKRSKNLSGEMYHL